MLTRGQALLIRRGKDKNSASRKIKEQSPPLKILRDLKARRLHGAIPFLPDFPDIGDGYFPWWNYLFFAKCIKYMYLHIYVYTYCAENYAILLILLYLFISVRSYVIKHLLLLLESCSGVWVQAGWGGAFQSSLPSPTRSVNEGGKWPAHRNRKICVSSQLPHLTVFKNLNGSTRKAILPRRGKEEAFQGVDNPNRADEGFLLTQSSSWWILLGENQLYE